MQLSFGNDRLAGSKLATEPSSTAQMWNSIDEPVNCAEISPTRLAKHAQSSSTGVRTAIRVIAAAGFRRGERRFTRATRSLTSLIGVRAAERPRGGERRLIRVTAASPR